MTYPKALGHRREWQPILPESELEKALRVVLEIAVALSEPCESWYPPLLEPRVLEVTKGSLANGAAGLAVFFAYAARALEDSRLAHCSRAWLDRAIVSIAEAPASPALFVGYPGVAWAAAHLRRMERPKANAGDSQEEIENALLETLAQTPWVDHFDLIVGLSGIGVYALERLPDAFAIQCLTLVTERLSEAAQRADGGRTWLTGPALLPSGNKEKAPDGYFDLGVAHGVPGVIGFLAFAVLSGSAPGCARDLLRDAVWWLMSRETQHTFPSHYQPIALPSEIPLEPARLAWCSGDLGVAMALFQAAAALDDDGVRKKAMVIAQDASKRRGSATGVVDACLCHGAVGVAHVFNRLFQETGSEALREAAVFWYRRALEYWRPSTGVAGFSYSYDYVNFDGSVVDQWTTRPGLLDGAAGIGLALLSAATDVEPAWDALLLASMPIHEAGETRE